MMHVIGCQRKQFKGDPYPMNLLWWHSAFCEGEAAIERYSDNVIKQKPGLYFSDGPSYGKAIVELVWRKVER